jgi:hypothetical protein
MDMAVLLDHRVANREGHRGRPANALPASTCGQRPLKRIGSISLHLFRKRHILVGRYDLSRNIHPFTMYKYVITLFI